MTLRLIQGLYEKKLTTYPRVDTQYLSDDIYPKCPQILNGVSQARIGAQQAYLPSTLSFPRAWFLEGLPIWKRMCTI